MHTPLQLREAVYLLSQGCDHRKIALITGISRSVITDISTGKRDPNQTHVSPEHRAIHHSDIKRLRMVDQNTVIEDAQQAAAQKRHQTKTQPPKPYDPLIFSLRFKPTGILWQEANLRY